MGKKNPAQGGIDIKHVRSFRIGTRDHLRLGDDCEQETAFSNQGIRHVQRPSSYAIE
jgi:hypothetical protein